ncbi:hypothetical protein QE152_g21622 [Popillia japonica]|uniref:Uncharacterized protein n=1 Tax=Popillia japonica TaxID=7064 RepID=A0AAW1KPG2_POPJA
MSIISEVNLDTAKKFESPHIGLILPEETSLLNTDDNLHNKIDQVQSQEERETELKPIEKEARRKSNLTTPKTKLILKFNTALEESHQTVKLSLLNTDNIMSGITPNSQNMEVQPEEGLKISELHRSDSKDLNHVIAREIESLLELQTQELSEDTTGDVSSNATNKIENEEKYLM